MTTRIRGGGLEPLRQCLALGTTLFLLLACSPIRGFPENPADNDQVVASLQASADSLRVDYNKGEADQSLSPEQRKLLGNQIVLSPEQRKLLRNRIVLIEMQIYEIYFSRFQQRLWGDNNIVTTGGALAVLILNGLAATTGDAATKSALAAAAFGIVGAQGAINQNIYYQRTLPALLAQMSANRDRVKAAILDALNNKSDADYPLAQAELDLQVLQRASGIVDAVQAITETATAQKIAARALVETYRTAAFSTAASTQRILAWLGKPPFNPSNRAALQKWVDTNVPNLPVAQLLSDRQGSQAMEDLRQLAITDLKIPP